MSEEVVDALSSAWQTVRENWGTSLLFLAFVGLTVVTAWAGEFGLALTIGLLAAMQVQWLLYVWVLKAAKDLIATQENYIRFLQEARR